MRLLPESCLTLLVAMCLLATTSVALGNTVSFATVEDARVQVNTDPDLVQADRAMLLDKLDAAQQALESAAGFRARTAKLRAEREQAPQRTAEFEQRLQQLQDNQQNAADVVDPNQPVKTLDRDGAIDGGEVLPGFSVPIKDILRE